MTTTKQKIKPEDYASLSLELDEVLAQLQRPDTQVDVAVELYAQGLQLINRLETHLKTAENTIKKLSVS